MHVGEGILHLKVVECLLRSGGPPAPPASFASRDSITVRADPRSEACLLIPAVNELGVGRLSLFRLTSRVHGRCKWGLDLCCAPARTLLVVAGKERWLRLPSMLNGVGSLSFTRPTETSAAGSVRWRGSDDVTFFFSSDLYTHAWFSQHACTWGISLPVWLYVSSLFTPL